MTWFLRLFRVFRDLESQASQMANEKLQLQDRVDAAESERSRVWAELQRALESERETHRMYRNQEWQTRYGVTPHPDAPHLPASMSRVQEGGPIAPRRVLGGALQAQSQRAFVAQYRDRAGIKDPEPPPAA